MTERQKGIKKEMKLDICTLFDKIRIDIQLTEQGSKVQFKTGEFSFLILNLIQLCSFTFLNFFCGPAILTQLGNYTNDEINIIFSNDNKEKEYLPNHINRVVNNYLYELHQYQH